MLRSLTSLVAILCFSISLHAQGACSVLADNEEAFIKEAKDYLALGNKTKATQQAFAGRYRQYRDYFLQQLAVTGNYAGMAAFIGLKEVRAYCGKVLQQGNEMELLKEVQWAFEKFLPYIDFGDKSEISCSTGANSTMHFSRDEFRDVCTDLVTAASQSAFALGKPEAAMRLLMTGNYYMNGYKRSADLYGVTGAILHQRLVVPANPLIDDTTFIAAYYHLYSCNELKSLADIAMSFGKSYEKEALSVITDNRFLNYKVPETKHGFYYYYPYPSYFQSLYDYLCNDTARQEQYLQQGVLKMLLKTWYANGKTGLDYIHFSQQLTQYGTNATQAIIAAGDKELMELVADFIAQGFNTKYYDQTNYCGYLLYAALHMDKKANKLYKRVAKDLRGTYPEVKL